MKTGLTRGVSSIATTAALSIAVLIAVVGMQLGNSFGADRVIADTTTFEPAEMPTYFEITDDDGNGVPDWQDELAKSGVVFSTTTASNATTTDALSSITANVAQALYGGYLSLKQYDQYSPERGEQLAASVVANLKSPTTFTPHVVSELSLSSDVSEKGALEYRARMREALAPMITDEAPEFELFAKYLATKDTSWLDALALSAQKYRKAEKNMLATKLPQDAAPEHLRALNALGSYATTLEQLSRFGSDALAAAALVQSYNDSEKEMLAAFDALAKYYVRKITN